MKPSEIYNNLETNVSEYTENEKMFLDKVYKIIDLFLTFDEYDDELVDEILDACFDKEEHEWYWIISGLVQVEEEETESDWDNFISHREIYM